jgi:hypothetical protein
VHLPVHTPSQGEGDDGLRESTHDHDRDRNALPFQLERGRRLRTAKNERVSVSETFCHTWTLSFWGHKKRLHCNTTASVWIVVGASRHAPVQQSPQAEKASKNSRQTAPSSVRPFQLHTPDLIRSSSSPTSQGYDQGPLPCSPSAYPRTVFRTVFRIISVSSSFTSHC